MSNTKFDKAEADLQAARREYHESADKKTAPELRKLSNRIEGLQRTLAEAATEGARDCPNCKQRPHGMRRTEATRRSSEIWQIGCLGCPPLKDGKRPSASGFSREQAVAKWNAGDFDPIGEVGMKLTHGKVE